MITKSEITNRVKSLAKGETTAFESNEIGKKPGFGIIVKRNEYQGQYSNYTVSQCGDMIGQNMSLFETVDFVAQEAGI